MFGFETTSISAVNLTENTFISLLTKYLFVPVSVLSFVGLCELQDGILKSSPFHR